MDDLFLPPPAFFIIYVLLAATSLGPLIAPANSSGISFDFQALTPQAANSSQLRLQGDAAFFAPSGIQLTNYSSTASFSAGRVSFAQPVLLWNRSSGYTSIADFSTHFSFTITKLSPDATVSGDGIAFFLSNFPSVIPNNSYGGYLGVFSADNTSVTAVAVEFDTVMNPQFFDISWSHVGIDLNSIVSSRSIDLGTTLQSGIQADAWVSYESSSKNLSILLSYRNTKWSLYHVVDLTEFLPEQVAVGVSAATGAYAETHLLLSWNFSSSFSSVINNSSGLGSASSAVKNSSGFGSAPIQESLGYSSWLGIGMGVGAAIAACITVLIFCVMRKKVTGSRLAGEGGTTALFDGKPSHLGPAHYLTEGPRQFTLSELLTATDHFNTKLGAGASGEVYKGLLSLGQSQSKVEVAIKKIRVEDSGFKEYMSELSIVRQLRHKNLVQLLGYCHEENQLLLVYEYMPNRSLDYHLSSEFGLVFEWPRRYIIAQGLASALQYLHEEYLECVIHRDVKPSNVMLDATMNAKLGDFGIARLTEHGLSLYTTNVAGTWGYISPEYLASGRASTESDVYSYGVVAIEIATGRSPFTVQEGLNKPTLTWVQDLYNSNDVLWVSKAADERLVVASDGECTVNLQEMERLLTVGLWCCHDDPNQRPSMRQVISLLKFEAPLPELLL